ncbi:hypothetical protein [Desulfoluna sp.]|uniref:hypothetical protein n=1 Tax=Desulfoluna sp. TaxID=2045199 RepID=UPI002614D9B4|nr:hypothetical protein [Desulfoluna sp.]
MLRPAIKTILPLFGILLAAAIVVADPNDQILHNAPASTLQSAHHNFHQDIAGSPRAYYTGKSGDPLLQPATGQTFQHPAHQAAWKNPPLRSDYPN